MAFLYQIKFVVFRRNFYYIGSTSQTLEDRITGHKAQPVSTIMRDLFLRARTQSWKILQEVPEHQRYEEEQKAIEWYRSKGYFVVNHAKPLSQQTEVVEYYDVSKAWRFFYSRLNSGMRTYSNEAMKVDGKTTRAELKETRIWGSATSHSPRRLSIREKEKSRNWASSH